MKQLMPQELIEQKIYLIRGQRVMLDSDLARLYDVPTKRLNEQVRRNKARFPEDFMFQLTKDELNNLRSQIATSSLRFQVEASSWGGTRYLPYAFTEHGILMLSSVLNSERAVQVNIAIMRVFVKLRDILSANKEFAYKLKELESKIEEHDEEIIEIFGAIRQMMIIEEKPKREIGFQVPEKPTNKQTS